MSEREKKNENKRWKKVNWKFRWFSIKLRRSSTKQQTNKRKQNGIDVKTYGRRLFLNQGNRNRIRSMFFAWLTDSLS